MPNTQKVKNWKKTIDTIIEEAIRQGAAHAKRIPISHIVLDERVRLKCQIPLCDSYNHNLMCPPRLPSVSEFRKILKLFSQAILIQITAPLAMKPSQNTKDIYLPAKKLHTLINTVEKMAFEDGYHYATGLIGGCCRLCPECSALTPGTRCRHPFQARPSMEAMGIDVMLTLEKAGMACSFPVTDHIRWTGLLLI
jgi:predicted metal-binding protein